MSTFRHSDTIPTDVQTGRASGAARVPTLRRFFSVGYRARARVIMFLLFICLTV